jgi:diguanylate cyclase (GGDEF)-like protein/PAS domain S-box-containing protein
MALNRYKSLFRIYPDACLITTADALIIEVNPAAQTLFMADAESLIGQSLQRFVATTEHQRFQQRLDQLRHAALCMPTWEITLCNHQGEDLPARLTASSWQDDDDSEPEIYWCIQDLSQRQAAMQALRQVNQTLESEVHSRTQELTQINQILQQKIKTLKQAQSALKLQTAQERLVEDIARKISQSLDLDEILDTTVSEVRKFLETDRVLLYRFKPDWSGTVTVESAGPGVLPILYTHIEEPCFRTHYVSLYEQGRVRAIDDIYHEGIDDCHLNLLDGFQVKANLVVPVLHEQKLWGLLIAHHCRGPRHWQQIEVELLAKLALQVGIAIHQAELYQRWQHLATMDGLTEVSNRRHFNEYLKEVWLEHQQIAAPISLVLADIDFFKQYNDTYGHLMGDDTLRTVAKTMDATFKRSIDLVARYGGEEFVALLPGTDLDSALDLVASIRIQVKALKIEHQGSPFGRLTLSFGLACMVPQLGQPPDSIIDMADQALYQAKANGRNCIAIPPSLSISSAAPPDGSS